MSDHRTVHRTHRRARANIVNASPGSVTVSLDLLDYDRLMGLCAELNCTRSAMVREMVLAGLDDPAYLRVRIAARALVEAARKPPVKALRY